MVWWYCAFAQLWREHWLQKMRFVGSNAPFSLMFLYTLYKPGGGQTCSIEESFAENQKHQRAAKPVCSVNTNTIKNTSFTLNDVQ